MPSLTEETKAFAPSRKDGQDPTVERAMVEAARASRIIGVTPLRKALQTGRG